MKDTLYVIAIITVSVILVIYVAVIDVLSYVFTGKKAIDHIK